jgi:enoyl-CoA hydratase/carnithine racemase
MMAADAAAGEVQVRVAPAPDGGEIAHVTIAREAKLNTLTLPLMAAFMRRLAELGSRPALRAVVLTGAGPRAFVGGADIATIGALADGAAAEHFIRQVHGSCAAVRGCPVPVIARINGWTLGAGLELAAACDVRVAAESAQFGMPEVRVGIPSVVEAALLPGLIGWGRTRRLLLLGEAIGAAEAERWGLVERVVPDAALDRAVEDWIGLLCAAGPAAIRAQKALIRAWENLPLRDAVAAGIGAFADAWQTDEPQRLTRRFLERQRAGRRVAE